MKKLKNLLFVLTAFVFFLFGTQIGLAAETGVTDDGFEWSCEDGIMEITGYTGNAETITIPSKINNLPVGLIGFSAFYGNPDIKSVTIPNSVTKLGAWAFRNCVNLTSITIPDSVTYIHSHLVMGCINLKSVRIPKSVTHIEWKAFGFYEDELEEEQKVPGFTIYGYYGSEADIYASEFEIPFVGDVDTEDGVLTKLVSYQRDIVIPEGIKIIGKKAFAQRFYESIKLPNTVTKIGEKAFSFCSDLTSINIPKGVTEIGAGAFEGCYSLQSISIPNGITKINDNTFIFCESLKTLIIPNSVTEIEDSAFAYCYGLTSVTIPDSVTKIEAGAFFNCCDLKSIKIPATVKKIGDGAFGMENITGEVEKINGFIIYGYSGTAAEIYAAENGIKFMDLSHKTFTVSEQKYKVNKDRTSVTYSGSLDKEAVKVKIPDTVTVNGIKYNVTGIKKSAFRKNTKLKTVMIGKNVTTIGDAAFMGCTALKEVTVGKNVTQIGKNAFYGCKSLRKVTFEGRKIKKVGTKAFTKAGNKNYNKLQVIVPKTKYSVYKKKLIRAGLNKNAKIKKNKDINK